MCIKTKFEQDKSKMLNRSTVGRTVRGVVRRANIENRLICGLLPAISYLEKAPEDVVLCVLPETKPGDAATHMQTVLLQAFCYENYIPVIQVDSSEKLANYCGLPQDKKDRPPDCQCVIIMKDEENQNMNDDYSPLVLSPTEQALTDFYEYTIEEFPRPVIELPV